MCCSCKNKWDRKSPLFYSLLIPLTLILLFVCFCSQCSCLLLLPAACVMVLWWLLVYTLFPKIVVTIKDIKDIAEFKDINKFENLELYVDGRCVYNTPNAKADVKANKAKAKTEAKANKTKAEAKANKAKAKADAKANKAKADADWPPTQFTFHVWKRGIYQLLLVSDTNESAIETANTYEHAVCNVVFGNNAKGN